MPVLFISALLRTNRAFCSDIIIDLVILLVITMIVNEFIITIGFGGRGTRSIRGRVLFCSNNAAVRGLIEEIRYIQVIPTSHSHALFFLRNLQLYVNVSSIRFNDDVQY